MWNTSLLFDLNYKFELIGASLLALAKSIYYFITVEPVSPGHFATSDSPLASNDNVPSFDAFSPPNNRTLWVCLLCGFLIQDVNRWSRLPLGPFDILLLKNDTKEPFSLFLVLRRSFLFCCLEKTWQVCLNSLDTVTPFDCPSLF